MVNKAATTDDILDADIDSIIALADMKVREDISKVVDLVALDLVANPDWINELSRFKTNEWVLVKLFGGKRNIMEVSDIQYWQNEYDRKIEEIQNGDVDLGGLELGNQEFDQDYKDDTVPALGHGFYMGHLDEDDLEDVREEDLADGPDRDD